MSDLEHGIQIEDKIISEDSGFIIAEVGSNHGQNLSLAIKYIEESARCGVDAVKFQFFKADDLVDIDHEARSEVERYVTPLEWIPSLKAACLANKVLFFASTFNSEYFEVIDQSNVALHKIASSEVLNSSMLLAAAKTQKPILISFGMSEWYEIEVAMKILRQFGNEKIIPLHCVSKYPLKINEANLSIILKLKERYGGIVGFSDHTESVEIGGWAAMLGARVFEKHITLDSSLQGADHSYALEPSNFLIYVRNIRESISSIGHGEKNYLNDELLGRRRLGIRTKRKVNSGEVIGDIEFDYSRPRTEIPANMMSFINELKIVNDIEIGKELKWKDLQ